MPTSARTQEAKGSGVLPSSWGHSPGQSVQGSTAKAGQHPALIHSRNHPPEMPKVLFLWPSCLGCPVPYRRSQWDGRVLGSAAGAALTILPQRLLCRFISARASFTFFSLASTKALAKRIP